jgi:hypothetical protein
MSPLSEALSKDRHCRLKGIGALYLQGKVKVTDGRIAPDDKSYNFREAMDAAEHVFRELQDTVPFTTLGNEAAYQVGLTTTDFLSWERGDGVLPSLGDAVRSQQNRFRESAPDIFYQIYPVPEEKRNAEEWYENLPMAIVSRPYDPLLALTLVKPELFKPKAFPEEGSKHRVVGNTKGDTVEEHGVWDGEDCRKVLCKLVGISADIAEKPVILGRFRQDVGRMRQVIQPGSSSLCISRQIGHGSILMSADEEGRLFDEEARAYRSYLLNSTCVETAKPMEPYMVENKTFLNHEAMFEENKRLSFRGTDTRGNKDNIVSCPGKYGAYGWGAIASFAIDDDLQGAACSCVFLPDEGSLGYGEHVADPDYGGTSECTSECFCHAIYGVKKPWGCFWFSVWRNNVLQAVKLNHKLQVYFFAGAVGEGRVDWAHLREHGRLHDAILEGVSDQKERQHIVSTELFPFDGLGQSQKAEVAWLEKQGYDFEMLDIGPFLVGARIMSVGSILPPSRGRFPLGTRQQCLVSVPMSAYFNIYKQVMEPLVRQRALSSAAVYAPPHTPYHGKHSNPCYCKQLGIDNHQSWGCKTFAKWINNVNDAVKNELEILVFHSHGMVGKGKSTWEECSEMTKDYDRFQARRKDLLTKLPEEEQQRLAKLSTELRDEFHGESRGSERGDEEQRLFLESLSEGDQERLASMKGLGRAQRAEVAWLDMQGIAYTAVDIVEWAKQCLPQCAAPRFAGVPIASPTALYKKSSSRVSSETSVLGAEVRVPSESSTLAPEKAKTHLYARPNATQGAVSTTRKSVEKIARDDATATSNAKLQIKTSAQCYFD